VHERTNVRSLTPEAIGGPVELTVADLSFISLRLVLPALAACTADDGDLALMVKPQFEVGRELVGEGGVVRDPALRADAVLAVARAAADLGLGVAGVAASPLPGPSGNVEFFVWFRRDAPPADPERVRAVVAAGPPTADRVANSSTAGVAAAPLVAGSDTVEAVTVSPSPVNLEPVGAVEPAVSPDPALSPDPAGSGAGDQEEPR
jgi:23S rRNA (cytidine1920-2'-O)/16S rRNA (cytidine1409-2'-O)-methyltransferase